MPMRRWESISVFVAVQPAQKPTTFGVLFAGCSSQSWWCGNHLLLRIWCSPTSCLSRPVGVATCYLHALDAFLADHTLGAHVLLRFQSSSHVLIARFQSACCGIQSCTDVHSLRWAIPTALLHQTTAVAACNALDACCGFVQQF
jgi:hypothetical protein